MSKEVVVDFTGSARGKLTRYTRKYIKPLDDSEDAGAGTLGTDGYMQWDVGVRIDKDEKKVYDVHIVFADAKKKAKVFAKPGEDEGKVDLSKVFPEGWTGSYDLNKGEITLEAPKDPGGAPGYDPNKNLPKGNYDFSFAFKPATAKLGKVTVTFTDSGGKTIATSDGKEALD